MPALKKLFRDITTIMEDTSLTEEEWRQEMTASYKEEYMQQPHMQKLVHAEQDIRKMVDQSRVTLEDGGSSSITKILEEEYQKTAKKRKEAENRIDEIIEDLISEDRKERTEFAAESSKDKEKEAAQPDAAKQEKEKEAVAEEPEKKSRDIDEILKDRSISREDWQQELTDAYKEQYMSAPHMKRLDKQIKAKQQEINEESAKDDMDPDKVSELAGDLSKLKNKRKEAEAQIDKTVDGLIRTANTIRDMQREDEMEKMFSQEAAKKETGKKEADPTKEGVKQEADPAVYTEADLEGPINTDYLNPNAAKGIFKATEEKKEKASEEVLKVDKAAELNFDEVDKAAKTQADHIQADQVQQTQHMTAANGKSGLKVTDLKGVPHKEVDEPQKEVVAEPEKAPEKAEDTPKREPWSPYKDPEFMQKEQQRRRAATVKGTLKASQLKAEVPHVEAPQEEVVQQETQPEKEAEKKGTPKPAEPQQEAPKAEEPVAEAEEPGNVMKAFKLLDIFQRMKGNDSMTHINSDKYNSMMKAMGNVEKIMGDGFGDDFGTLMRDFGNLSSFQDLCKKGGPLDLAVGQALSEVEKKCDAYVQEKTHNLTKTHMGSGLGNARLKDAMDSLSILNKDRAEELGKHISIDVLDGKSSKRMNYNELNKKEREQEQKEMDEQKKKRMEVVDGKKKQREKDQMQKEALMSKEEKSKQQGMRLK